MAFVYTLLLYAATPLILVRLWWRGRRQPAYRQRIAERFGRVPPPTGLIEVWVHAVSVGESVAAAPLIEALLKRHGEGRVWVTTTTPTGSARITALFGARVHHSYIPYDWPDAVSRFLARVKPRRVVVMETELWPNLFRALARRGIPLVVANARLSPRSYRRYARLASAMGRVLSDCQLIAAQSEADAERFRQLGAPRVKAIGNLKFDLEIPEERVEEGRRLRAWIGADRPVWVAASTHEGEEDIVLDAHRKARSQFKDLLLILVPRHPERFNKVGTLAMRRGFVYRRHTGLDLSQPPQGGKAFMGNLIIGDTMGQMFTYLAAADVAFVGGSLVDVGGHNVLEPAALGLPVLFGPHMHNFEDARRLLLEHDAAFEVEDAHDLATHVAELFMVPERRRECGAAGREAVAGNRGAVERLLEIIDRLPATREPPRTDETGLLHESTSRQ